MFLGNSGEQIVQNLDALILARLENPSEYPGSATIAIANGGLRGIAEHVGEEAAELQQAILQQSVDAVLNEAQQLVYMTALGIAVSGSKGGLSASLELALALKEDLRIKRQNDVVKNLGRAAGGFCFALGSGGDVIEPGARILRSVDVAVLFRQLSLISVLERI